MEQKIITQQEKSAKILKAEEKVRQAKAELAKAHREEKKQLRKDQDHHKFIMGGITKDQMRKFLKFVHDDVVYCKYYEVVYILSILE